MTSIWTEHQDKYKYIYFESVIEIKKYDKDNNLVFIEKYKKHGSTQNKFELIEKYIKSELIKQNQLISIKKHIKDKQKLEYKPKHKHRHKPEHKLEYKPENISTYEQLMPVAIKKSFFLYLPYCNSQRKYFKEVKRK